MSAPKRSQYLNLRVRKSELVRWKASARSTEQSLSDWIRTAADTYAQAMKDARAAEIPNRVVTGEQRDLPLPGIKKRKHAKPDRKHAKPERATAS